MMTQNQNSTSKIVKFLYSYGGKIVLRHTDGKLRYFGGHTRVLSVDRSITFAELMVKFGESCGSSMNLKCKLPHEDLDVLISIKSDEDLKNVIEEYEKAPMDSKIRAVLTPIDLGKKKAFSTPSSPMSCFDFPSPPKYLRLRVASAPALYSAAPATHRCNSPVVGYPVTAAAKYRCYERSPLRFHRGAHRNGSQ